jgi:hypothetical protein
MKAAMKSTLNTAMNWMTWVGSVADSKMLEATAASRSIEVIFNTPGGV